MRTPSSIPAVQDRPLAVDGLASYRCRSPYGWIMIGARDDEDAMREARRSTAAPRIADLQIWDGSGYVDVEVPR